MGDPSFTAISLMVLILLAISARRLPSGEARRQRMLLLLVLAAFVGLSYFLSVYVSPLAGNLWATLFWLLLAAGGWRLRDRGLVIIGLVFAALYFLVGIGLPLLAGGAVGG